MSAHLARAQVLIEQSRYEMAEGELRQALAQEPDHALAHALLALCLVEGERFAEAGREAETAVHLAPDLPFAHHVMAGVLLKRNRPEEAEAAAAEALRLDPGDADYFALLGMIRLNRRNWPGALEAAEEGLRCDAQHVGCTNLRAVALVELGRRQEAGATIDAALARDPEDSVTHANMGWTLLESGERRKALAHFREALRLDPRNEWARHGIVEGLKSTNFIYAIMLKYSLWMARLSGKAQWAVILGGYFGYKALGSVAKANPAWAPWINPILILYCAFIIMTWIASPLFNLILRLNRFGRLALSREEVVASNWIGVFILLALGSLGYWLATKSSHALTLAMAFGFLLLPVAGVFHVPSGWPRRFMAVVTAGLFFLGVWGALAQVLGVPPHSPLAALAQISLVLFFLGIFGSQWIANFLMAVRVRK